MTMKIKILRQHSPREKVILSISASKKSFSGFFILTLRYRSFWPISGSNTSLCYPYMTLSFVVTRMPYHIKIPKILIIKVICSLSSCLTILKFTICSNQPVPYGYMKDLNFALLISFASESPES